MGGTGVQRWRQRLNVVNTAVSFGTFFVFTLSFLSLQSSAVKKPQLGSVYVTHYEESGRGGVEVLVSAQEQYRITNFITVPRLQAYMFGDWILLAREMGCGDQQDVIGLGGIVQEPPEIFSPMCKCAYEEFLAHLNISKTILGGALEELGDEPFFNNSLILDKVAEINAIKTGPYSRNIITCFTQVRGSFRGKRLGIGNSRFLTLNPFVLIVCILASSCFTRMPWVYKWASGWVGEEWAEWVWWAAFLPVLICNMLAFVYTDSGLWGLLLLYTGTLLLDSVLRNCEATLLASVAWNVVRKGSSGGTHNLLAKKTVGKGVLAGGEVSEDLFWTGYITQLPMFVLLADVAAHRRDATVLGSGLVAATAIATLSMALESANRAYFRCALDRTDGAGKEGKGGASIFQLVAMPGARRAKSHAAVSGAIDRSMILLWSAGVILWYMILGKVLMRYSVDAPYLQATPRDERYEYGLNQRRVKAVAR